MGTRSKRMQVYGRQFAMRRHCVIYNLELRTKFKETSPKLHRTIGDDTVSEVSEQKGF